MRYRYSALTISTILLTVCLATFVPGSLRNASTWTILYLKVADRSIDNFLMPFGLLSLGIVAIGLFVLWTGYKQREWRAWVAMLIIFLCFVVPMDVLQLLVRMNIAGWRSSLEFLLKARPANGWSSCIVHPGSYSVYFACMRLIFWAGLLRCLVMLIGLLLPIKAFFWDEPVREKESTASTTKSST